MDKYILIISASSGTGYEMAKILASKNYNLILVAKQFEKIKMVREELQKKYKVKIQIYEQDLSCSEKARALYNQIKNDKYQVEMLVNNDVMCNYGKFIKTSLQEELNMIGTNIISVVTLTKLFSQDMVKEGGGTIMNMASLLSFLPLPYYAVYSGTKSFVLAFSETTNAELQGTGVRIKALCPSPFDTGFTCLESIATNADDTSSDIFIAEKAIKLLLDNKSKQIVGFNNWIISNLPRITTDNMMMKIKKKFANQIKK